MGYSLVTERYNENASEVIKMKVPLGPKLQVFSCDDQKELGAYILDMESGLYGLTTKDFRGQQRYRLVINKNKSPQFNKLKKKPEKTGYQVFESHPEWSIRQSESASVTRAAEFNK